jgi:hypothetical protein
MSGKKEMNTEEKEIMEEAFEEEQDLSEEEVENVEEPEDDDEEFSEDEEDESEEELDDSDEDDEIEDEDELDDEESEEESDELEAEEDQDDQEPDEVEEEPEATNDEISSDEILSQFSRDQIPGTDEYTDNLIAHAKAFIKKKTGEEFDSFDEKHIALYNQAINKLDKAASDKFHENYNSMVEAHKAQQTQKQAYDVIDKLLPTETLANKFDKAIRNLTAGELLDYQQAAKKGDYSGFIELAKRVSNANNKFERIKSKNTKNTRPPKKKKSAKKKVRRSSRSKLHVDEYGGVADMLGYE